MKKIFLLIFCLITTTLFAEEFSLDKVIYVNQNEQVQVPMGTPVVFSQKQKPKEDFIPQKVLWKPSIPKVEIETFMGEKMQVPFATHIPAMAVFVQILSDKSIVITERITFISSQFTPFLEKEFPVVLGDNQGKSLPLAWRFLYARHNGKNQEMTVLKTDENYRLRLFEDKGLSRGVHLIEVSYLLSGSIHIEGNTAKISFPLMSSRNPYLVNGLQVFISYPPEMKVMKAEAYYGKNHLPSSQATRFYLAGDNHLVYTFNGLLPIGTRTELEIFSDSGAFETSSMSDQIDLKISQYAWLFTLVVSLFVLWVYFKLAIWDLKDKVLLNHFLTKVRSRLKFELVLLRPLLLSKYDRHAFLVAVLSLLEKKALRIEITAEKQVILYRMKSKAVNGFDKKLMRFIFPHGKKKQMVSQSLWDVKKQIMFSRLIKSRISQQVVGFFYREIFVAVFLIVLSALLEGVVIGSSCWQVLGCVVCEVVFIWCLIASIKKMPFLRKQLAELFSIYEKAPKSQDRQMLCDVALEQKNTKRVLDIIYACAKISLDDFEDIFFDNLRKETKQ